jgi:hypothetical protein
MALIKRAGTILAADLARLGDEAAEVETAGLGDRPELAPVQAVVIERQMAW